MNASKLIAVLLAVSTTSAFAENIVITEAVGAQLQRWKPEDPTDTYELGVVDAVVGHNAKYFVVRVDAGISCPPGHHWLFNKQTKSYRSVDAGTCEYRNFKVVLKADKLIFLNGKKITAQYPIY